MCQWIRLTLIQIMACHLYSTKPLSKPMQGYCQFLPYEQNFSEILNQSTKFSPSKMYLKISSVKWWPFCPGGDGLREVKQKKNEDKMRISFQIHGVGQGCLFALTPMRCFARSLRGVLPDWMEASHYIHSGGCFATLGELLKLIFVMSHVHKCV